MTGFVVPTCQCGHVEGEHLSGGAGWPHPPVRGICIAPGCDCKQFTKPEQKAAA